ncbi:hypothetical protein Y032_0294g1630 [Ancylostoma ceylanicum]|uniref:Uncharacterized protein n=1 Tax=Ancylostoma ceylanicum TaxID=53326 RepID=A0A016S4T8_9BILA|nr:hypothetical protein Y032_0294g1630 [Ancylostoma ceylanicum]
MLKGGWMCDDTHRSPRISPIARELRRFAAATRLPDEAARRLTRRRRPDDQLVFDECLTRRVLFSFASHDATKKVSGLRGSTVLSNLSNW